MTLALYDRHMSVRRFPPGRAIQTLRNIDLIASRHGLADLQRLIVAALAAAMTYIRLRARRQTQRLSRGDGKAGAIDREVDNNVGQIYDLILREAEGYPETPIGKSCRAILAQFFQGGLWSVTRIPYEEEVVVVEMLVDALRAQHADTVAELGLARQLRRIEALLPAYQDALNVQESVSATDVGEAYAAMQVGLKRVVAWILALDTAALQAELIAPVEDQDARLAAVWSARRQGETGGEDLPEAEMDLDAEARAAVDAAAAARSAVGEAGAAVAEGENGLP